MPPEISEVVYTGDGLYELAEVSILELLREMLTFNAELKTVIDEELVVL